MMSPQFHSNTNTQPPPRLWCDVCDEQGTMILAEFPVLYNYADYKFTPEEHIKCRLDPSQPDYDPVAERVLLKLLEPERF